LVLYGIYIVYLYLVFDRYIRSNVSVSVKNIGHQH